jgi:NAD(P)-dependent dehydrogenase (short-subunit alcohol dehydrogenase family)
MAQQKLPVAVVVGVGPGLGAALAHRFAANHAVAILARRGDFLRKLAEEIRARRGEVLEITTDVTDASQIAAAFRTIEARLGPPEVLLYNAGSGTWGGAMEITPEQFENTWRTNAMGAFLCVKQVVEGMVARGHGTMIFTGATAGMKAGPRSAAFGPAKFALRGLAQSLARDLGPRGIHCAWVNIDGVIDIPGRQRPVPLDADHMLRPAAIAETYWHLAHQDRSAWTMELELRPFTEKF